MNGGTVHDGHRQFRLEYFPSPQPVLKTSHYTTSSNALDKTTITNRQAKLISVGCDCACTGQK